MGRDENVIEGIGAKDSVSFEDWMPMPDMLVGLCLSSFFINLLSLAFPIALLQIYDRVVPNNAEQTLMLLSVGVLVALVLETVLKIARAYVSTWADARMEYLSGTHAFDRLIHAKLTAYEKVGTGKHFDRLATLGALKDFYGGQVIITIMDLPFLIIFLALIAYINFFMVLVPIAILIILPLFSYINGKKLKHLLARKIQHEGRRSNFIVEILTGIHTIKSYGMEALIMRRYERMQECNIAAEHRLTKRKSEALGFGSFFSQLNVIGIVALGSVLVVNGQLTIGGLAACTLLSSRILQPINRALSLWSRFQSILLGHEELKEISQLPQEQGRYFDKILPIKEGIRLENIGFQFDQGDPVLKNINLTVNCGEMVTIRGDSASGKSTLLSIIAGLLSPTEGTIFADKQDIGQRNLMQYREQVAYLPQHCVLFEGSLLDNLTMFRGGSYVEKALSVARALGLDKAIEQMPEGYQTEVGQGAVDFIPRGMKQRIAIVRALLDRPPVVLFDEANTAMDMHSDLLLRQLLERMKGQCAFIMVTHRPSFQKIADKMYRLENGVLTREDMDTKEHAK